MDTVIATLYRVDCHFDYLGEDEVATWHCATLEGAHRFVEKQKGKGLDWYAIQGEDYIP